MYSDEDTPCGVGCPIRRSRDHRSLASPPGFSQRATSFIASQCQGIHQMPLLALDPRRSSCSAAQNRRAQGQNPYAQAASHEDTSSDTSSAPCFRRDKVCAGRVRLGHMTNSLFTLQTTPPPGSPRTVFSNLLQTPDGGGERIRTDDLLLAKQALSQLSYTPLSGIRRQGSGIRTSDY